MKVGDVLCDHLSNSGLVGEVFLPGGYRNETTVNCTLVEGRGSKVEI